MEEESLACEGIVDVGLLVISHFDNPAKQQALDFLKKVLLQEIRAAIPTTAFLGAYHIMTSYLKLAAPDVSSILSKTLSLTSNAFYEQVRKEDVLEGYRYCLAYSIESWDAFLLSLARRLGTRTVFSIDRELKKQAKDFTVVNPIPEDTMKKYHSFLSKL